MALTSLTKDFITRAGLAVEGTSAATTATYQSGFNTGTFQAAGGASISKNLIVGSTATIYGPLIANSTSTFNQPVLVNSSLTVQGLVTFGNFSATNFVVQTITVNNTATFNGQIVGNQQTTLGNLAAAVTTVTSFYATGQSILQGVTATVLTATNLIGTGETVLQGLTATVVTATTLTVTGQGKISGNLIANSNSTATGAANGTGALQVTGGAGISGALYVGNNAYISGDLYVDGTQFYVNSSNIASGDQTLTLSTGSTNAALAAGAGLLIGSTSTPYASLTYDGSAGWVTGGSAGGDFKVSGPNATNSTNTGALQVVGGVGISGGLFAGGVITATNINAILGTATNPGNIYGGVQGDIVYQSGVSQTTFLAPGLAGYILATGGPGANPYWVNPTAIAATSASNLVSLPSQNNDIPYQSGPNSTSFSNSLQFYPTGGPSSQGLFTTTNILVTGNNNATAATGNSGSLMVVGGIGVSQDLWVGGNVNINGNIYMKGVGLDTISGSTGTFVNVNVTGTGVALTVPNGSATIGGGLTVTGQTNLGSTTATIFTATNLTVDGSATVASTLTVDSTLNSTSTTTGSLVVYGGIGVAQDMWIGGSIIPASTSSTLGTLAHPFKSLYVSSSTIYVGNVPLSSDNVTNIVVPGLQVTTSTGASSTNTGAVQIAGGVGIGGGVFVGATVTATTAVISSTLNVSGQTTLQSTTATNFTATTVVVQSTTNSTSSTTGALTVTGGVGVGQNIVVGGTITAGATLAAGTGTVVGFLSGAFAASTFVSSPIVGSATQYLDVWSTSSYRTSEYLVQITDSGSYHIEKILVLQDGGTNVYMTEFGVVTNNGELGTFDVGYSGSNVVLKFTPNGATSMVIKLYRTSVTV